MPALRLILADQLSSSISSLRDHQQDDVIMFAEVKAEATYVKHHKKKIAFLFSAMRHFAEELEQQGRTVKYIKYDNPKNTGSLFGEVARYIKHKNIDRIIVTEPAEYRLLEEMQGWQKKLKLVVELLDDDRFIATKHEFNEWSANRKELIMEYWYRDMRRKTGLLMEGNKPIGGKWNFDKENRKPMKERPKQIGPMQFSIDKTTAEVLELVEQNFDKHFGDIEPFWFAVTRSQAKHAFTHFVENCLPFFGDYQDAMLTNEAFNYHSVVSQYINCGLLDPIEVCEQVEQAYHDGHAPLNAAEGFIRQIIGWREFIRGVYWKEMPDYAKRNELQATRPLPAFYWGASTDMHCLSQVVGFTKQHAYSHHIQRLMVTGNFANLAGLDVDEVCEWYLAVYADAFEWVELPNTLGMALYADGGMVGTKPYVSSGAYINRMSDFCKQCKYDVKKRVGEDACPFTTLYWDYLMRHEQRFKSNHRMTMPYRNLQRFSEEHKKEIRRQAKEFLMNL